MDITSISNSNMDYTQSNNELSSCDFTSSFESPSSHLENMDANDIFLNNYENNIIEDDITPVGTKRSLDDIFEPLNKRIRLNPQSSNSNDRQIQLLNINNNPMHYPYVQNDLQYEMPIVPMILMVNNNNNNKRNNNNNTISKETHIKNNKNNKMKKVKRKTYYKKKENNPIINDEEELRTFKCGVNKCESKDIFSFSSHDIRTKECLSNSPNHECKLKGCFFVCNEHHIMCENIVLKKNNNIICKKTNQTLI